MGNTMQRRQFLRGLSAKSSNPFPQTEEESLNPSSPSASFSPLRTSGVQSGIAPYSGPFTESEMLHLLRRITFGAPKSTIAEIKGMTMSAAVDYLIDNPVQPATTPVNNYTVGVDSGGVAFGSSWMDAALPDPVDPPAPAPAVRGPLSSNRTYNSFKPWWMGQLITQRTHILEKITLFWSNYFGTDTNNNNRPKAIFQHHKLLRTYGLGNFGDLLKQVTIDPHMLYFLNGVSNTRTAPNENYGREVQELFAIGSPGKTYTEGDVQLAAKVLTGWQVRQSTTDGTWSSYFTASRHDTTTKVFSDFYKKKSIAPNGDKEYIDLINMLLASDECAKHVVRRLYRWFVYSSITADIETNVIEPLATIFRNSNYSIPVVLKALFKSEHFFDPLNRGGIIKSPIDLYVSLAREFKITLAAAPVDIQYAHWKNFSDRCANSSEAQNIGDPPNVFGWPAYYNDVSKFYESWMTGASIQIKAKNLKAFSSKTGITVSGVKLQIDPIAFNKQFSNPGSADAVIADYIFYLLPFDLTDAQKATMKNIMLNNQANESYWTSAWNDYMANPTNTTAIGLVQSRLYDLLTYITGLAEFFLY